MYTNELLEEKQSVKNRAVEPVASTSNNAERFIGQGFQQFLDAKMRLKKNLNESAKAFDNADEHFKHIILSYVNQRFPKSFTEEYKKRVFADFTENERLKIIDALNDFQAFARKLPRYFSPHDAKQRRVN